MAQRGEKNNKLRTHLKSRPLEECLQVGSRRQFVPFALWKQNFRLVLQRGRVETKRRGCCARGSPGPRGPARGTGRARGRCPGRGRGAGVFAPQRPSPAHVGRAAPGSPRSASASSLQPARGQDRAQLPGPPGRSEPQLGAGPGEHGQGGDRCTVTPRQQSAIWSGWTDAPTC